MLRDDLSHSSLGTRMQHRERKEPTTTTQSKGADILLLRPGVSASSHFVFSEERRAMQIAPSAVFPLVFCFLWLFVVTVVLSAETEELRDERVS